MDFLKKTEPEQPQRQEVLVKKADPEVGLTNQEAKLRAQNGWSNGLAIHAGRSRKDIIREKCFTFYNMVFLILALVILISGSDPKNLTFLIVVLCNTLIGIYQEMKAKRSVDRLTLVAAGQLRTVRDGKIQRIRSDHLVRDDIVEYVAGDQICADGIVRTGELSVNEALVTGEEDAIVKCVGERVRSGSFVVSGTARVQLTKVGPDSYAARLAAEAKADPHAAKSEMMRSLDKLIRVVGFGLIPLGVILFIQEFFVLDLTARESVDGTVSALIGVIPEGLYLLTSVAMAISAMKLARRKVLVQDMNCIETLARVDVLCVDKTGTITESVMEVENVIPLTTDPPEWLENMLSAFYSGQEPENDTARAMSEMFAGGSHWECLERIPFTSAAKWSAATFKNEGTFIIGAPEIIMSLRYNELKADVESWSKLGYRVLLVARYDGDPHAKRLMDSYVEPLALVTLSNRIRSDAPDTFAYFAKQGVSIRVISGDNPLTVSEVARKAGIENADKYIDARKLETDRDFMLAAEDYTVFGRVTPEKKQRLIRAFKEAGHTVAMTGDGVNDVLAMKEADCGIAMAGGSQAACQVAQMVLLRADFSAMPGIVGEGRRVINNIQRAATLYLAKNIFSLGLSIITLFTKWPYPMEPLQLSIISLLTIGIPSFFLALEPNYEQIGKRFLPWVLRRAFPGGLVNIFVVLMAQAFMASFDLPLGEFNTVCAGILSVVGLLVLYETCKPFDKFRVMIWWAMAIGLVACFTYFGGIFNLQTGSAGSKLVMITLLIMTPTVFFSVQKIFDFGDKLTDMIRKMLRDQE